MPDAITYDIDPQTLVASPGSAVRFSFESRFVPMNFRTAGGVVLESGWARAMIALRDAARAAGAAGPNAGPLPTMPDGELGLLWLERTRIEPAGFRVGERLYSMSLAPGEEVVLEQNAFSERQTSYEDETESSIEQQQEYSSTLTSEIGNSLANMMSENQTRGWSIGGRVSGEIKGVTLSVEGGYQDTVSNADQTTRQTSARNAQTSVSKVAATLRSQHKITFKVSSTDRFSTDSKRTVRNPNQYTPIDLVYFKIMQALSLSRERHGVRLCWAPAVRSPGDIKANIIDSALAQFEREALARRVLPAEPERPLPPNLPPPPTLQVPETELTKWGFFLVHDMSADYTITVPIPAGFVWDGDVAALQASLFVTTLRWGNRAPAAIDLFGAPQVAADGLKVTWHAGVNGGELDSRLFITFAVRTINDVNVVDPAYQKALADWQIAHDAWSARVAELTNAAHDEAQAAFSAWLTTFDANFDPVQVLMQTFIRQGFPPDSTDEFNEVEFWSNVFDFENAVVRTYPGWWTNDPPRDPTRQPDDVINASWARLFLPIRIGKEADALRWLYARGEGQDTPEIEIAIGDMAGQLRDYRTANFGGPGEVSLGAPDANGCPAITRPFVCLGHWDDLLPTDGTHLEVIQAVTTAMDAVSRQTVDDAHAWTAARTGLLDAQRQATAAAGARADVAVTLDVGLPSTP